MHRSIYPVNPSESLSLCDGQRYTFHSHSFTRPFQDALGARGVVLVRGEVVIDAMPKHLNAIRLASLAMPTYSLRDLAAAGALTGNGSHCPSRGAGAIAVGLDPFHQRT